MQLFLYPPNAVSVTFPPGAASEATLQSVLTQVTAIATNQYLPIRSYGEIDFSSTNVDNSAWVQLIADVGATAIKKVQIFMSSGDALYIGVGAAASEVTQGFIVPGGNGFVDLEIPANSRVSVKAVEAVTVSSGSLLVNFLG
jgi:hypothetical protein